MRNIQTTYRARRENPNADILSHYLVEREYTDISVPDVQVAQIRTAGDIPELLQIPPLVTGPETTAHYSQEQEKDPEVLDLRLFVSQGQLPDDLYRELRKLLPRPCHLL